LTFAFNPYSKLQEELQMTTDSVFDKYALI